MFTDNLISHTTAMIFKIYNLALSWDAQNSLTYQWHLFEGVPCSGYPLNLLVLILFLTFVKCIKSCIMKTTATKINTDHTVFAHFATILPSNPGYSPHGIVISIFIQNTFPRDWLASFVYILQQLFTAVICRWGLTHLPLLLICSLLSGPSIC